MSFRYVFEGCLRYLCDGTTTSTEIPTSTTENSDTEQDEYSNAVRGGVAAAVALSGLIIVGGTALYCTYPRLIRCGEELQVGWTRTIRTVAQFNRACNRAWVRVSERLRRQPPSPDANVENLGSSEAGGPNVAAFLSSALNAMDAATSALNAMDAATTTPTTDATNDTDRREEAAVSRNNTAYFSMVDETNR